MGEDLWENEEETSYAARLTGLLQRIYQQTGKQVVVLIDEYDAPLLDSNSDSALQGQLRTEMRKFFSPLKAQGQYLRFLFFDRNQQVQPDEHLQ